MATVKWTIDPTHSEIQFKVKHLMISKITGGFKKFDATVTTKGEDLTTAKINFTADISSISTNNEQRDAHLRGSDFFEAETHPELHFESDKLEKKITKPKKCKGNPDPFIAPDTTKTVPQRMPHRTENHYNRVATAKSE